MNLEDLLGIAANMAHHPVHQYATPGLTSSLVGGDSHGTVRLFVADRDTREWVTPHSHRFNFACLVLRGEVENITFVCTDNPGEGCNRYAGGSVRPVDGGMGKYEVVRSEGYDEYLEVARAYRAGDIYSMNADEIHSIRFGRGTHVLFFEGPNVCEGSVFLEPWSNGKRIQTFETRPWMFERGA